MTGHVEKWRGLHRTLRLVTSLCVWVNMSEALMTNTEAEAPVTLGACSCWCYRTLHSK